MIKEIVESMNHKCVFINKLQPWQRKPYEIFVRELKRVSRTKSYSYLKYYDHVGIFYIF